MPPADSAGCTTPSWSSTWPPPAPWGSPRPGRRSRSPTARPRGPSISSLHMVREAVKKKADPSVEFFMSTKFRGTFTDGRMVWLAKILKTDCQFQLFTNTSVELQVGVDAQQSIHVADSVTYFWSRVWF